jgi:hypothetical protein
MTLEPLAPEDADALRSEHRDLDALLAEFLSSASSGALATAVDAIARFDDAIRVHVYSEEGLYPPGAGKLVALEGETDGDRLFRELRLEFVQIKELSGMIRRVLGESADLAGALNLGGNLARRWESHVKRSEEDWLDQPSGPSE